eukprot:TRINITY_DN11553_c0_g1_i1.p1 TRINITY_DN11553_c0_g1~~TRINITY_DN11553_c0_g1_i1.p1  ORF type:complete len:344 (-),score=61.06 TRINITY_DN11553_c0_g1_i1:43-1074(-)
MEPKLMILGVIAAALFASVLGISVSKGVATISAGTGGISVQSSAGAVVDFAGIDQLFSRASRASSTQQQLIAIGGTNVDCYATVTDSEWGNFYFRAQRKAMAVLELELEVTCTKGASPIAVGFVQAVTDFEVRIEAADGSIVQNNVGGHFPLHDSGPRVRNPWYWNDANHLVRFAAGAGTETKTIRFSDSPQNDLLVDDVGIRKTEDFLLMICAVVEGAPDTHHTVLRAFTWGYSLFIPNLANARWSDTGNSVVIQNDGNGYRFAEAYNQVLDPNGVHYAGGQTANDLSDPNWVTLPNGQVLLGTDTATTTKKATPRTYSAPKVVPSYAKKFLTSTKVDKPKK